MSTHIGATKGEIAQGILLPGDPLRAKYIAENFLENPVLFNEIRGMLGYTGGYKGKKISVMGTGMGMPSISIYATELFSEYDVKAAIRIGTAGSLQKDIHTKDVLLCQGACNGNYMNRDLFSATYCAVSDFDMLYKARALAKERGIDAKIGNVLSHDEFYGEELVDELQHQLWIKYGAMAVEMESAALLTIAKRFKARAMALLTISDSVVAEEPEMTPAEREKSLNDMIIIALDTMWEFI